MTNRIKFCCVFVMGFLLGISTLSVAQEVSHAMVQSVMYSYFRGFQTGVLFGTLRVDHPFEAACRLAKIPESNISQAPLDSLNEEELKLVRGLIMVGHKRLMFDSEGIECDLFPYSKEQLPADWSKFE